MDHFRFGEAPMSALLWLIPIGAYVWFAYIGDRRQKETVTAYFWLAILGIGLAGILFSLFTTGSIPLGCCGDE